MHNLVLVNQANKQKLSDFVEIRRYVCELAGDIAVHIVDTKQDDWPLADLVAARPTMTVSPMPIRRFRSPRGPVYQGFEFPKCDQYEKLRRDGMPVPDWQRIEPGSSFDPGCWGPYVVVKPDLGRCGAEVRIMRTSRVRFRPPDGFAPDHPARKAPMLVQRFVYTGPWASSYRVVTLFGKALLCWHCEIDHRFRPLEARYDFAREGGVTIVSNKKSSVYSLSFDDEVIALAEAAHRSFPEQALLGHDVARDVETGELFILECNPRGDAWLFSSPTGVGIQQDHGLDFYAQFGGLARAARILVRETRKRAC
jgi:hypothetical protein